MVQIGVEERLRAISAYNTEPKLMTPYIWFPSNNEQHVGSLLVYQSVEEIIGPSPSKKLPRIMSGDMFMFLCKVGKQSNNAVDGYCTARVVCVNRPVIGKIYWRVNEVFFSEVQPTVELEEKR